MPTKWYINLQHSYDVGNRGDTLEKKHGGNPIRLVAKRGGMSRRNQHREVDWTVNYPPDAHDPYVAPNSVRLQRARSAETDRREFENQLHLPYVGGRVYTVTAARTDRANDRTLDKQYETWQRIYYSIHFMNDSCERLFKDVKRNIAAIFAEANIELKQRSTRKTRKDVSTVGLNRVWERRDEPDTEAGFPPTLDHLYESDDPERDRGRAHLRVVVVNDLVDRPPKRVHWTMDQTTNTDPAKYFRVWWDGPNNQVHLFNQVAVVPAVNPVSAMTVTAHGASVNVPGACKARTSHHVATIDLTADGAVQAAQQALAAGRRATLRGSLRGRRCAAGYVAGNIVHQYTLDATIRGGNPLTQGTAKAWTSANGLVVFIEDERTLLDGANCVVIATATIQTAPFAVVQIPANHIRRDNDHRVQIDAASIDPLYNAIVAGHRVQYDVTLNGLQAQGDIEDEADHEFEWEEAIANSNSTKRKVAIAVAGNGNGITFTADWLVLARANYITLDIEDFAASIDIPGAAFNRASAHEITIDLSADLSLAPALQAMNGGRSLTFDGQLNGQESYGGYSPGLNAYRWFVALSAKRIGDQSDATVARRMLLTFCHEIGHALGLTNDQWRDHVNNANVTNDNYYRDEFGGQGPHCHYNAELVPSGPAHGQPSTTSGEIWAPNGVDKLCIMYHASSVTHCDTRFCPNCIASLQRHRVSFG